MSSAGFVHLHVHSSYSLLEGALIKIAKLADLAKADREPALALTDTDNMFGALEFSDKMAGVAFSRSWAANSRLILAIRTRTRATRWRLHLRELYCWRRGSAATAA